MTTKTIITVLLMLYYAVWILAPEIKTKKTFWLTITPLSIIIYPIMWAVQWYKTLK